MNRHELEARLKQIREEKAALEQQGEMLAAQLREQTEERNRARAAEEAWLDARKAAREQQRSSFWGRTKLVMGISDKPKGDFGEEPGLFGTLFSGLVTAATLGPKSEEMQKRMEELQLEEARILDQLEPLQPKAEQTRAQQREKIYEEMAQRKAEWERVRSRETAEEKLMRLKNIYDDADARDEEKLRKLL